MGCVLLTGCLSLAGGGSLPLNQVTTEEQSQLQAGAQPRSRGHTAGKVAGEDSRAPRASGCRESRQMSKQMHTAWGATSRVPSALVPLAGAGR